MLGSNPRPVWICFLKNVLKETTGFAQVTAAGGGSHAPNTIEKLAPLRRIRWTDEQDDAMTIAPAAGLAEEDAAQFIHQNDLGTLQPGKLADIIVLEKNPLTDIRNIASLAAVGCGLTYASPLPSLLT